MAFSIHVACKLLSFFPFTAVFIVLYATQQEAGQHYLNLCTLLYFNNNRTG